MMRSARLFTTMAVLLVLTCAFFSCAVAQERAATLAHAEEETLSRAVAAEPVEEERQDSRQVTTRQPDPDPLLDSAKLVPLRAVERSLKGFVDFLLPAALTLAGVGILVMALIQLLKDLIPTRRWFQLVWMRRRIKHVKRSFVNDTKKDVSAELRAAITAAAADVMGDMVRLAAAGDSKALFDLTIEKLAGQLASSAETALDDPTNHLALLAFFARDASSTDIETVLNETKKLRDSKLDDSELRRLVDARARVHSVTQRTLDAMQIALGSIWARTLRWTSVLLGGTLIYFSVKAFVPAAIQGWKSHAIWLMLALVGGFVAPVARDLVAALQSIRSART